MKKIWILFILLFPLSCYNGLSDMYDDLTMKVPICVNSVTGNDANDGRGWTNAYQNIETALNNSSEGDVIWLAGNFTLTGMIAIGPDRTIYGGFDGIESRLSDRPAGNKSELTMTSADENIINASSSRGILIDGLTFKGVSGTGHAVHVENGGSITFKNCIFKGNRSSENGSAIYSTATIPDKSTVVIEDCVFTDNISTAAGGAIYITNSTLTVSRSVFGDKDTLNSGNTATSEGGAIFATGTSTVNIQDNCEFYRNKSTNSSGGALYAYSSTVLNVENSFFGSDVDGSGNTAPNNSNGYGGAVYSNNINSFIKNSVFNLNSAFRNGGAIRFALPNSATAKITGCTFKNNTSSTLSGGAIFMEGASSNPPVITISGSLFEGNTAYTSGGSISTNYYVIVNILNSEFITSTATSSNGGAIHDTSTSGEIKIESCKFNNNNSGGSGGGVYHSTGNLSVINTLMEKNDSIGGGGAICSIGTVYLRNCTITDNNAQGSAQGGGIYLGSASANLFAYNSVIWGNTVNSGGAYNINTAVNCVIQPLKRCYFNGGIMDYSGIPDVSDCINSINNPFQNNSDQNSSVYLRPNSELEDKGNNSYLDLSIYPTDLAGNPRIVGGTVDMGCYERQ